MEWLLDIVIIIMIAVMITYSVLLNIKLKSFRNAQNEMATMIGQLNNAISLAQSSVADLKAAAIAEEGRLEGLLKKARLTADELEIITQSGSNLAERIERGLIPSSPENEILSDEDKDSGEAINDDDDSEMLERLKKVR